MTEHDPLSEKVIGCAFKVHSTLGPGFAEKVYENALAYELRRTDIPVQAQRDIEVQYDGVIVGQFVVDLLVEGKLLVEIKATKSLDDLHLAQGLNYLRATGLEVCLLLNFGASKLEIRRLVPAPHWPSNRSLIAGERCIEGVAFQKEKDASDDSNGQ